MKKQKGLLIVISGPSGAGKGTICQELLKRIERKTGYGRTRRGLVLAVDTLSFAVAVKWHIRRRFWPALGFLIALPMSGWTNICLNNFFKLPPLQLPDPWLSGGLLTIGSILGLWLAAWYSIHLKKISGHSLNR